MFNGDIYQPLENPGSLDTWRPNPKSMDCTRRQAKKTSNDRIQGFWHYVWVHGYPTPPKEISQSYPIFQTDKQSKTALVPTVWTTHYVGIHIKINAQKASGHHWILLPYSSKHLLRLYLEIIFWVYINIFSEGIWSTRVTYFGWNIVPSKVRLHKGLLFLMLLRQCETKKPSAQQIAGTSPRKPLEAPVFVQWKYHGFTGSFSL